MDVIGDRHYRAAAGERIQFSLEQPDQVADVAVTGASAAAMPCDLTCNGHQVVTVTVAFTGNGGGSVQVVVEGSGGGRDVSRIRQLTSLGFRSGIFVID